MRSKGLLRGPKKPSGEPRLLGNPECLQWALHCLGLAESSADPEFGIVLFEEAMAVAAAVDSRLGSLLTWWNGSPRNAEFAPSLRLAMVCWSLRIFSAWTGVEPLWHDS